MMWGTLSDCPPPMSDKPFSPAAERNSGPILEVLRTQFAARQRVLEIGSGNGQHAVHFATAMPWLTWQCTDRPEYLPGICQWVEDAGLANLPAPRQLDVDDAPWSADAHADDQRFDAAFSANTLHIMGWPQVQAFFAGLDRVLAPAAGLVVYGPFNFCGDYTSYSNREFDAWLKARDPASGIRDFEAVDALAQSIGLRLVDDVAMPANNRCLAWTRG